LGLSKNTVAEIVKRDRAAGTWAFALRAANRAFLPFYGVPP